MTIPIETNTVLLDSIPCENDATAFLRVIEIPPESDLTAEAAALFEEAIALAQPKAVYRIAFIDQKLTDSALVDGVELCSHILRVNLEPVERLFPFIATCGMELEEWSHTKTDPLVRFWADSLKELLLRQAYTHCARHLKTHHNPGKTITMTPGSLEDWPIQEQKKIFTLLAAGAQAIDVRLNDSFLMIPTKSLAGVWIPSEKDFVNCKLCPRENCSGRQAQYDPEYYPHNY